MVYGAFGGFPILLALLMCGTLGTGCAKMRNDIAAQGGFFTSHEGDYIVRNDSGGRIMDVSVLHDVMVQSTDSGSGWLFRDNEGNPIHLGGDVKVIRIVRGIDQSKYHEYHAELETKTYQELYCK